MKLINILLALMMILLISCGSDEPCEEQQATKDQDTLITIKEDFLTKWDDTENIDSQAFWQSTDKKDNWIIATAKEGHSLVVYNAENGERVKTIGKPGSAAGDFNRPNGIWVIDDLAFVVERDNKRVQVLTLPDFSSVLSFGDDKLIKPYGLTIFKENDHYRLFVTDNYETEYEQIPADSLLDKRVLEYKILTTEAGLSPEFVKYIGETSEKGALRIVESIYADPENNILMIAEEDERNTHIKVYDLDGNFTGKTIGESDFKYQAEGIALFDCGNGEGFWVFTDQSKEVNTFRLYTRKDIEFVGVFKPEATKNTDGIWLTQMSYPGFEKGAFFAVHDDGGVAAFSIARLFEILGLECK
jgi:3-phytase